jgi:lipid-A-disaccharide synthase
MRAGWFVNLLRKFLLKVKYISLVNLIVDRELVPELVAGQMTPANLSRYIAGIVKGGADREAQLKGYEEMAQRLGEPGAPQRAAQIICRKLSQREK